MLEWIVWIILFFVMSVGVFLMRYWTHLLGQKNTYEKEELVDFVSILLNELRALFAGGPAAYLSALAGFGLATLLTLLGGLLSPDTGPEPDWTTSHLPNYFFQSALSVLMFHLVWPSLRTLGEKSALTALRGFLAEEGPFFWSMAVSFAAFSTSAWGVQHQISFLFVLFNGLLLLAYAGYRLNQQHALQSDRNADDFAQDAYPADADRSNTDRSEGTTPNAYSPADDFSQDDVFSSVSDSQRDTEF